MEIEEEVEGIIKLMESELESLREVENPSLEEVFDLGSHEGSLDAAEWVKRAIHGKMDYQAFVNKAHKMFNQLIEEQRKLTNFRGSDEGWRDYAANTAWTPREYRKIADISGQIYVILDLNRQFDLEIDPELIKKSEFYMY